MQRGSQGDLAALHQATGVSYNALLSIYSQSSQPASKQQSALIRKHLFQIHKELAQDASRSILSVALARGYSPSLLARALAQTDSFRALLPPHVQATDVFACFLAPPAPTHALAAPATPAAAALARTERGVRRQMWAAAGWVDASSPHSVRVRRIVGKLYEYVTNCSTMHLFNLIYFTRYLCLCFGLTRCL